MDVKAANRGLGVATTVPVRASRPICSFGGEEKVGNGRWSSRSPAASAGRCGRAAPRLRSDSGSAAVARVGPPMWAAVRHGQQRQLRQLAAPLERLVGAELPCPSRTCEMIHHTPDICRFAPTSARPRTLPQPNASALRGGPGAVCRAPQGLMKLTARVGVPILPARLPGWKSRASEESCGLGWTMPL